MVISLHIKLLQGQPEEKLYFTCGNFRYITGGKISFNAAIRMVLPGGNQCLSDVFRKSSFRLTGLKLETKETKNQESSEAVYTLTTLVIFALADSQEMSLSLSIIGQSSAEISSKFSFICDARFNVHLSREPATTSYNALEQNTTVYLLN
jgi:glycogen debranching enzyme